tara:strand:- start:4079 stop:5035 length:957 start_codon:yes stop_codon:yes gene_type:complete
MNNILKSVNICTIGGGTGSSVLLRGLKNCTDFLTAIVTVSDDGGSSGILRKELGVLPPGDFRNCVAALSDSENIIKELFDYRFDQGEGLKGHSLGNLLIAAMSDITGNFEEGLNQSAKILGAQGVVLPSSLDDIVLQAKLTDGSLVNGESLIPLKKGKISSVNLNPESAKGARSAINALKKAELIIVGPGSLYTSLIPPLLVKDLLNTIKQSSALKIYICNVATQKGETDGFSVYDHIVAIEKHTYKDIFDYIVADENDNFSITSHDESPIKISQNDQDNPKVLQFDIKSTEHSLRHDSKKLSNCIKKIYNLWINSSN